MISRVPVQATIATLRAISQGRIRGEGVPKKARSVEEEIMSAYRIAEGLGIAVDPNYQLREPDDYDLIDVLADVIEHHRAEAEERGNFIKLENNLRSVPMWGDRTAIEVALGHLLMNAIKYSFDGAYVTLKIALEDSQVVISVINTGLELPKGDEAHQIWDFGYRGKEARERHVNGSGIGLYTVRKIVARHNGVVTARTTNKQKATWFEIRLPTDLFQSKLSL
jgi:signal transduction histidine kinase